MKSVCVRVCVCACVCVCVCVCVCWRQGSLTIKAEGRVQGGSL